MVLLKAHDQQAQFNSDHSVDPTVFLLDWFEPTMFGQISNKTIDPNAITAAQ